MICLSVSYNYFSTFAFSRLEKEKETSFKGDELVGLIYLSTFIEITLCVLKGVMFTRMLV